MSKMVYAIDSFEEEMIDMIEHSDRSLDEVVENYNEGCMLCTLYGRDADCLACPINRAAIAKAKWHGTPQAYEWIEKEAVLA